MSHPPIAFAALVAEWASAQRINDMSTIIVSGNIGVGKSTISAALATELDATLLPEIVDDYSYLGDFYRDKARWSFHSQNQFIVSKFAQLRGANGLVVQDGSAYESFGVFAAKLADDGHLMPREIPRFEDDVRSTFASCGTAKASNSLRAPIEQMLDRITRRDRPFERQFDRSYLLNLDGALFEVGGGF
ncbi:MAG: deoxynucleoside kinase [Hyphomicrobium sp.]|nr:deoxynucleoside kinase [Hyphomicrobium sp.]